MLKLYFKLKTTGLNPFISNIYAIGLLAQETQDTTDSTQPLLLSNFSFVKACKPETEKETLEFIWRSLSLLPFSRQVKWIVYNNPFDLAYFIHRSMILRCNTYNCQIALSIPELVKCGTYRTVTRGDTQTISITDLRQFTSPCRLPDTDILSMPLYALQLGSQLLLTENARTREEYEDICKLNHGFDEDLECESEEYIKNTLTNELNLMADLDNYYG